MTKENPQTRFEGEIDDNLTDEQLQMRNNDLIDSFERTLFAKPNYKDALANQVSGKFDDDEEMLPLSIHEVVFKTGKNFQWRVSQYHNPGYREIRVERRNTKADNSRVYESVKVVAANESRSGEVISPSIIVYIHSDTNPSGEQTLYPIQRNSQSVITKANELLHSLEGYYIG